MPTSTPFSGTTINYRRLRNIWFEQYTAFTPPLYLKSDPYEGGDQVEAGAAGEFVLAGEPRKGEYKFRGRDTVTVIPAGAPAGATTLYEYRTSGARLNPRTDTTLMSLTGQGNGVSGSYRVRGSKQAQSAFRSLRGISTYIGEFGDHDPLTGYNCVASGQATNLFISPIGRSSITGQDGQDEMTFQVTTPEKLLQNVAMEKLPFLNFRLATGTRSATTGLSRTKAALGFDPQGAGSFAGKDNLSGFAAFFDGELEPLKILQARACNEWHLLGRGDRWATPNIDGCAIPYAMWEALRHHVFADRGGGFQSLTECLDFGDIEWGAIFEKELPEVNFGPGSIYDAIAAAADETSGPFRWWFDALGKFHFIGDYYTKTYASLIPYVFFKSKRGLPGKLSVNLGSDRKRLLRQSTHGLWSSSANGGPPLATHFNTGLGTGVFPLQRLNNEGQAARMNGYHGYQVGKMAQYLYGKHSAQTTLTWDGFHDPLLAISMFNRVVSFAFADSEAAYDWTPGAVSPIGIDVGLLTPGTTTTTYDFENRPHTTSDAIYDQYGKRFVCDSFSITNVGRQQGGDDDWDCTAQFTEIIPLVADNRPGSSGFTVNWASQG